jgi:calcineurin-like phosphoesterase family protein
MTTWFTADHHFEHRRICELAERPFTSLEEHDAALEAGWNERVQPGDTVWHLGDFSFQRRRPEVVELLARLAGTKFLVRGNHDSSRIRKAAGWAAVLDEAVLTLPVAGEGQRIYLRHDPVRDWSGDGWHLHGHSHGTIGHDLAAGRVDVGVDCWGFKPVSLEELAVEIGVPA